MIPQEDKNCVRSKNVLKEIRPRPRLHDHPEMYP